MLRIHHVCYKHQSLLCANKCCLYVQCCSFPLQFISSPDGGFLSLPAHRTFCCWTMEPWRTPEVPGSLQELSGTRATSVTHQWHRAVMTCLLAQTCLTHSITSSSGLWNRWWKKYINCCYINNKFWLLFYCLWLIREKKKKEQQQQKNFSPNKINFWIVSGPFRNADLLHLLSSEASMVLFICWSIQWYCSSALAGRFSWPEQGLNLNFKYCSPHSSDFPFRKHLNLLNVKFPILGGLAKYKNP